MRSFLGGSRGNDRASGVAALRSEVDEPVGVLDHVEVVLDDDDAGASIEQSLKGLEQDTNVLEVESGGGLIEEEQGAFRIRAAHVSGQLETLRLSSRQGVHRLAEPKVAELHLGESQKRRDDLAFATEELQSLIDGEREDFLDVPVSIANVEDFLSEARPVARLAGDVDVGEELHLDLLEALARAQGATTAVHVEAERRGVVAALLRQRCAGEESPDAVEGFEIGRRIGPGVFARWETDPRERCL